MDEAGDALLFGCGGAAKEGSTTRAGNPCGANPCGANPCGGSGGGEAPSSETGIDWSEYESWTRVSAEPFPSEGHKKAWVGVYVTSDHAAAYQSLEGPMPEGMGIVKVAYEDAGGRPGGATDLTVMAKMAPGYDAEHGDWYYGVLSADGSKAMTQGKVQMCIDCHNTAESDYVFGVPE